ncbi:MAG: B12-binding domain-containing radical SAM protein [Candidatus Thorarchaeota archaeon]|jgi:anaerobic magnesium-protoporphyrin IX monomethyl ester cyclase
MRIMFVEPPKDYWFVMGEYLPPPLGILNLAAYLRAHDESLQIEIVDCNAERISWNGLRGRIETFQPDIVAPSSLSTCNAYRGLRTIELAKTVDPTTTTIVGGQHYTVLAKESLEAYPELDIVVRGEGEQTLLEVVRALKGQGTLSEVKGITFRHNDRIITNEDRSLIDNLDELPFPAYDLVAKYMKEYHFTLMAGRDTPYALVEASRGCPHDCNFCTQCVFWGGKWRRKTPKRIVDEIEFGLNEFGTKFFWLTDDNFGLGKRTDELCDEIISRGIADDIMWFMQARCDDIVTHKDLLPKLRRAGLNWILAGVESHSPDTLASFNKRIDPSVSRQAIDLLKLNDIFAQATLIIGERSDSRETLRGLRAYVNDMDPDLAIFMILTPYPGTKLYEDAIRNGWIEDTNWAHYDMIHAIMPTEHLTRMEVQQELYMCYRSFFGSVKRRITGVFSSNKTKRRTYRYMARRGVVGTLRGMFR